MDEIFCGMSRLLSPIYSVDKWTKCRFFEQNVANSENFLITLCTRTQDYISDQFPSTSLH